MKVPYVDSNQTSQNDDELHSRCHKYQECMKDYHDKKNNGGFDILKFNFLTINGRHFMDQNDQSPSYFSWSIIGD